MNFPSCPQENQAKSKTSALGNQKEINHSLEWIIVTHTVKYAKYAICLIVYLNVDYVEHQYFWSHWATLKCNTTITDWVKNLLKLEVGILHFMNKNPSHLCLDTEKRSISGLQTSAHITTQNREHSKLNRYVDHVGEELTQPFTAYCFNRRV